MSKFTFGSLFAGIGGFDLGFERAGFECRWQVEIDDYATKILEKHWPKVHRERDIRECNAGNLEPVDCIIGGFPCQDISYAGRGAGLAGERSGLFFEAIRLVRELQPRAVVLENVAALLTRGMDRVLGTLAEVGYDAQWHCIPAAYVGAPHIRDRIFIIATPADSNSCRLKEFQKCNCQSKTCEQTQQRNDALRLCNDVADSDSEWNVRRDRCVEQAKSQLREYRRSKEDGGRQWWDVEPNVRRVVDGVSFGLERFGGLKNVDESSDTEAFPKIGELDWEVVRKVWQHRELAETSPELFVERLRNFVPNMSCAIGLRKWLKATKGDEELHNMWSDIYTNSLEKEQDMQQRMLERVREAERSQTMELKRSRVDRLRCLGNAIVPQVAEVVAKMTKEVLEID